MPWVRLPPSMWSLPTESGPMPAATPRRIASRVRSGSARWVGSLVGGGVERSGDILRVTARLIDARSGLQLQSRTLEYPFGDLFALQDQLAQEVSRFMRERPGQEILLRERRKATKSVAAWELLQQGEASRATARIISHARRHSVGL